MTPPSEDHPRCDEAMILHASSALAALDVDHAACAEDYLIVLTADQLNRLGMLADRLSMAAFALAGPTGNRIPDVTPLAAALEAARTAARQAPVAPAPAPVVEFDMDVL